MKSLYRFVSLIVFTHGLCFSPAQASQYQYFCKFLKENSFADFNVKIKDNRNIEITFPNDESKFHGVPDLRKKNVKQSRKSLAKTQKVQSPKGGEFLPFYLNDYSDVSAPELSIQSSLFLGGSKLQNEKMGGYIKYRHQDLVLAEGSALCERK